MKAESKAPVLIKFQSKEIIDSFQSETVYMNKLNYFIEMEELEDNHEVGDYMEINFFQWHMNFLMVNHVISFQQQKITGIILFSVCFVYLQIAAIFNLAVNRKKNYQNLEILHW